MDIYIYLFSLIINNVNYYRWLMVTDGNTSVIYRTVWTWNFFGHKTFLDFCLILKIFWTYNFFPFYFVNNGLSWIKKSKSKIKNVVLTLNKNQPM